MNPNKQSPQVNQTISQQKTQAQSSPTTPPSVNPTPPVSPSHFSKILVMGIVIMIVIVILGAGAFVLYSNNTKQQMIQPTHSTMKRSITSTPTPDPTANWQTYTNTVYKVSLEYPPTDGMARCGGEPTGNGPVDGTEKDCVYLVLIKPSKTLSIPNISLNFFQESFTSTFVTNKFDKEGALTTIDGKPAYVLIHDVSSGDGYKNKQVYIEQSPTIVISLMGQYDSAGTISLFDTVLSTLKFTDQNQITDTSNWKTYTSPRYNPYYTDVELNGVTSQNYIQKLGGGYASPENIKKIIL